MPFRSWCLMLAAVLATLALGVPALRYQVLAVHAPGLADAGLRKLGNVTVDAVAGGFLLSAPGDGKSRGLVWPLPLPEGSQAVRVEALVTLAAVGEGDQPWHRAMLSVRFIDAAGKGHERAVLMRGGSGVFAVDKLILLPLGNVGLEAAARLLRVGGALTVSDLRVSLLAERAWVPAAVAVLWAVWLLAFAALLVHWLRSAHHRLLLVVVFVGVLTAVMMPGDWRDVLQQWATTLLGWRPPDATGGGLSDYVHFSMFALLGAALTVARRDLRSGWLLAELVLLAVASEVVQVLVPGREAGWQDVALDAGGAVLGVALASLAINRVRRSGNA